MADTLERLNAALAGRYRIERRLGQGGMATVYLAEDLRHQRNVAIKVLSPEIAAAIGHERFQREVEISASLRHPHILPLFESGEARVPPLSATEPVPEGGGRGTERGPSAEARDTFLFYVMPYVEGRSLRDRLEREAQIPVAEAIAIAGEVADALSYAHARDVIHRDIKPDNILLESGHAIVADFGIARAISAAGGERLTHTGMAIGTPAYMSPEQAAGSAELDGRSDIYALGCVLYEMLAGTPPFTAATPRAVIARHTLDPPPPLKTVRDTVPPGLEAAINKALAKVPADRFANAKELRDAILQPAPWRGGAGDARADVVAAAPGRARHGLRLTLAALVMLGAAAVVARLALRAREALDPNRIMVFPLVAAVGPEGQRTLGEDVATVIGNGLDGVGPLRWIDGWSHLDAERRDDVRRLAIADARALARARNCRWFVIGRVIMRGDSSEVSLALHDVGSDLPAVTGAATGAAAWQTALRAVNHLLPRLITGEALDLSDEWKDRVPAAVVSFLLAEGAFRRVRFTEALGHYRRAVELDSSFALAALRGVQAASWSHRPGEAASLLAAARRQPLAARYAAFARGLQHYLDGDADSAIASFREAVAEDPEMSVAWIQLGETYTHLLPRAGSPVGPAEAAFAEARRLDPTATAPLAHLVEVWLRRGNAVRAAPLVARLREVGSDDISLVAKLTIMYDCVAQGLDRLAWDELARTQPFALLAAAAEFGTSQRPCAAAAAEALLRADTSRSDDAESRRFFAQMILLNVRLAEGRLSEAIAAVDAHVARWGSGTSLYLLAAPVHGAFTGRAREVAREDAVRFGADYRGTPFTKRVWALGLWEAYGGSAAAASAVAAELERRASASGDAHDRVMATSVRAHALLAHGDTARAVEVLDAVVPASAAADVLKWDEALPLGLERLALARLLLAQAAYARAIEIADVFDSSWPVIYPLYLVPSLELRAEAAARLGEREREAEFRARLAALTDGNHP